MNHPLVTKRHHWKKYGDDYVHLCFHCSLYYLYTILFLVSDYKYNMFFVTGKIFFK